jgi:hypothetical protein
VNKTQSNLAKVLKRVSLLKTNLIYQVPQTFSPDAKLRFDDYVMLLNKQTNGYLVIDIADRIKGNDEAYTVTTSSKPIGPAARSIFVLKREDQKDGHQDNIVHYG